MYNKVIITGGTGFLGKKFIHALKNSDNDMEIIVSLRSENSTTNYFKNCRKIYNNIENKFEFDEQVSTLIHIASETCKEDKMWSINYIGTKNVLKWALDAGVKKIIYVSSIAVFGNNSKKKINESSRCNPINLYGRTKYATERLIISNCINNGTKYQIIRPSTILDTELIEQKPLLSFIKSISKGYFHYFKRPEKVYVNYVTINDVINCMVLLININIGNRIYILNNPIKLNELVDTVAKTLRVNTPKKIIPYNIGYALGFLGDLMGHLVNRDMPFNSNYLSELANEKIYDGGLITKEIQFNYNDNIAEKTKILVNHYIKKGVL
tara:strand:+ start:110 stop:1081 length:972 start_codon:yes stop_codon:yes gene_type:complete